MMEKNKKGIAMLVVVSLILMLVILGGAILTLSTGQFGRTSRQIKRARAYYTAEAAMQHVFWLLRSGQITPPQNNVPFPNDINGISVSDIDIDVAAQNSQGLCPITITVDY